MIKVILISGKAEHGKTAVANILESILNNKGYRVVRFAFADYLKFIAEKYFRWNGKKNFSGRELLQRLGTNVVRKNHPNFWADIGLNFALAFSTEFDYMIVDDCRFENEINVFSRFSTPSLSIRVNRFSSNGMPYENSLTEEQRNHESERNLDNYYFDIYVLNCGTLHDLEKEINKSSFIREF